MGVWNRWIQWTEAEGPPVRLAFFRVVVGFMLWRHTWAFVRRYLKDGFYGDKFYLPYWDWLVLPSGMTYVIVLTLMMAAGFFIIVGYKTRWALIVALTAGGFHLSLNQFWYGNNRYFLLLSLLLLCFSPCDRALSLDANLRKPYAWAPTWTLTIIRLQMTLIYLASATAKSLDADWRSGRVLWDRGVHLATEALRMTDQIPHGLMTLVSNRQFMEVLTIAVLSHEYFLAFGLWFVPTRRLAIWVGIIFHGYIEAAHSVLAFSYLSLGTYFLVISPYKQNRAFYYHPDHAHHQFWVRWMQRLDWFDKIKFVAWDSPTLRIQNVDGQWYQGWMAVCIAGSALVLPYAIAYPMTWLRFFGAGRVQVAGVTKGTTEALRPLMGRFTARLVLVMLLLSYIGFLWMVTAVPSLHIGFHGVKFVDVPLLFLILALMMAAYTR